MATLQVPECVPAPEEDSAQLKNAFTGLGTDEDTIIRILAHRNETQRNLIREAYAAAYGEDLLKDLEKEISGDFLRAVKLWTVEPAERDAQLANEATKMFGGSNSVVLEIACTRSSYHLFRVRQAYHARYKKSLEEDIAHHTTGDFRKAKLLHQKICDKAYADEEIIRMLTTRSKAQLNATLNQYNDHVGNAITKDLKADPNNEYFTFLRATIKCLTCPERYYAKTLRLAIKGVGTDENALTRVIVTQAEVSMQRIKEEYYKRNSVPIERAIAADTSGDYEKFLLALVGHEDV
ncbi:hypothetical protein OROGR_006107 [Orobanche gracilis]